MKKHWQYLQYVIRHKWFVFVECVRFGLIWQGIVHDWHKFLPDEWFPYVESFYGGYAYDDRPPDVVAAFDRAWNAHQKRAKHHWQYWVMFMDSSGENGAPVALEMPERYRREMVADWTGAGLAITGRRDPAGWYDRVKDVTILHPETRRLFENEIGYTRRETMKQAGGEIRKLFGVDE